jgi:peroxiredoxin Q/BCP
MSALEVGAVAPEFSVAIEEGKWLKLSELRGKNIVLFFYPKDNTPGCTVEAKDFNALLSEFNSLNTEVIGISKDNLKSHEKFREKYDLKMKLGADTEGSMCQDYGVWVQKSMFGKKYMGINRTTFLIDKNGKIAYMWPKVSVLGHAKKVLSILEEIVK